MKSDEKTGRVTCGKCGRESEPDAKLKCSRVTCVQKRGETKAQRRLRLRIEAYVPGKDGSTRKPGSGKKSFPEGKSDRKTRAAAAMQGRR